METAVMSVTTDIHSQQVSSTIIKHPGTVTTACFTWPIVQGNASLTFRTDFQRTSIANVTPRAASYHEQLPIQLLPSKSHGIGICRYWFPSLPRSSLTTWGIRGWTWQAFPIDMGTGVVYITMSGIHNRLNTIRTVETVRANRCNCSGTSHPSW
jgi:hypothetical protein